MNHLKHTKFICLMCNENIDVYDVCSCSLSYEMKIMKVYCLFCYGDIDLMKTSFGHHYMYDCN